MNLSRKKFIPLIRIMALSLTLLMIFAPSVEAGSRRVTGDGGTLRFSAGERVAGEIISLRNADGTWGKTWYRCKLTDAPRKGRVTSGVIQYTRAEVKNLPNCRNTLSSPTPRRVTGEGNWRSFRAGYHVLGFAIETGGRTYFSCGIRSANFGGRVISGVVNPSRFELRSIRRCSDTTNWRPGYRTESGASSLPFQTGDWIVAAYIKYDDGSIANNGNACYTVAPQDGTLYGGVRNYWPGEEGTLPHC